MGKDKNGSFGWLLGQSEERKGKFIASVVLAAISMLCGIVPYYFIACIVKDLLAGCTDKSTYIINCVIILLLWLGHSLFHALSTANSHLATFHTLAVIRKKALDKLAKMPLGNVISQPSGALKSTIVERIDSIETTLAHAYQIIVIDGGQIAQQGTHDELMQSDGIYRRFVESRREAASWRL